MIGLTDDDIHTLRIADRAHEKLQRCERVSLALGTERARRLVWTALVDRYQYRPDTVAEMVVGAAPAKEFQRLLECWANRPQQANGDAWQWRIAPPENPAVRYNWYAIVGASGVGKSEVGAELSRRVGRRYVDMDRIVESAVGRPLAELFADRGSRATFGIYTDVVEEWVRTVDPSEPLIVSFGGGSIVAPAIEDLLVRCAKSLWLAASPRTLLRRIHRDEHHSAHMYGTAEFVGVMGMVQLARSPIYGRAEHWLSSEAPIADVIRSLGGVG
jgi:shikimate kinase